MYSEGMLTEVAAVMYSNWFVGGLSVFKCSYGCLGNV